MEVDVTRSVKCSAYWFANVIGIAWHICMEWQAHGKALEGAGVSANRWVEPLRRNETSTLSYRFHSDLLYQFKENRASTRLLDI